MEVVGADIAAAVKDRQTELHSLLARLAPHDLLGRSLLPDWNRLTIACHLRYGAEASRAVTADALAGRPAAYYPAGRSSQRPATLRPTNDDTPAEVLERFGAQASELDQLWATLSEKDWNVVAHEPADNVDLGPMALKNIAMLRLTEVEVHGSDLDIGAKPWSEIFVDVALPMRVHWLPTRRSNHHNVRHVEGTWALCAADGPSYVITADSKVVSVAVGSTARAVIGGTKRDLLSFLLGRRGLAELTVSGDLELAGLFRQAFPGP